MIRGTTPTIDFKVNIDTKIIQKLWITFKQSSFGKPVLIEKTEKECTVKPNNIYVDLTQEETLKFTPGAVIEVQIRILTTEQRAMASQIIKTSIDKILKEGVIE